MIVETVHGDVLASPYTHIAFAVNAEGINDDGFAGFVSSKDWPELAYIGPQKLGDILTRQAEGRVYHALVCHSLGEDGWKDTPAIIERCLNKLDVPDGETIAVVKIGGGLVGQMMGADVDANLKAIAQSNKKVVVYSL